ncbi:hypothetical protein Esti_003604 [Eimeria stiedai]
MDMRSRNAEAAPCYLVCVTSSLCILAHQTPPTRHKLVVDMANAFYVGLKLICRHECSTLGQIEGHLLGVQEENAWEANKISVPSALAPVGRVDSTSTIESLQRDPECLKKLHVFAKTGAGGLEELNSFTRAVHQTVKSFQAEPPKSIGKAEQLLSSLRKRFDDVHVLVQKRAEDVARYKEGIRQADAAEQQITNDRARLGQRTQNLTQALTELQEKVKEADHRRAVYLHILQRTKIEKEEIRQRNLLLQDRLKCLAMKLKDTRHALEKQQRTEYKVNCEVKQLEQELKGERLVRQHGVREMEGAIGLKKAAVERKNRLVEWQQSVVDDAAAAALSASSGRWRRMLCVEKLIANLLQKTNVENVEKWQYKEDTFQKIREATGLVDVMDIVSKFLNRDMENQKLKQVACEAERKLEVVRKEYQEVIRRAVEDLTLGSCSHVRDLYGALDAQANSRSKTLHGHATKHYFLDDSLGTVDHAKQCAISINRKLAELGIEVLSEFTANSSLESYYLQLRKSSIPFLVGLSNKPKGQLLVPAVHVQGTRTL